MEKRNYIKPSCEVVTLNSTQSLLASSSIQTLDKGFNSRNPQLVGKKKEGQEVNAWNWDVVLWNDHENDIEEE